MGLYVWKFGGTSVGNLDLIQKVAARVISKKEEGHDMVIVLSAMAGETDRLLNMARKMATLPDPREVDVLISTGEQVSVALFCLACQAMGVEARSLLGFQARILTNHLYGKAEIKDIDTTRIRQHLGRGRIVAVAGFQGQDDRGNITTLGRGGSDTTAVALSAALKADVCEIFTDVTGVFTTDPNVCPEARKMNRISYEEMLEMASLGAKVMETRSVGIAMQYGVPIHVRHSRTDEPGTMICEEEKTMEDKIVSGVAYSKNEARITITKVPDRPGIAAKILSTVSNAGIVVDMIIQNSSSGANELTDFSFTVPKPDFERTMSMISQVAQEIGAERVLGDESIAKVSIIGVGMRSHAGVATKMFAALAKEGINIIMISTSEIKISCVIAAKYTELAVRALHEAFELHK
ncbi:MAG: aspartate kinase [Deltaproteobacteria bacterium]|nr:aspartate kinase [Deltaproteobacteria bacterium]